MDQFFGVGYGGAIALADGLVAQAYAQNGNAGAEETDGIHADACVFRTAGTGGDKEGLRVHFFQLRKAQCIVPDDFDIRIEASCQLIEVIGKAVIVINQNNHLSSPPSAR